MKEMHMLKLVPHILLLFAMFTFSASAQIEDPNLELVATAPWGPSVLCKDTIYVTYLVPDSLTDFQIEREKQRIRVSHHPDAFTKEPLEVKFEYVPEYVTMMVIIDLDPEVRIIEVERVDSTIDMWQELAFYGIQRHGWVTHQLQYHGDLVPRDSLDSAFINDVLDIGEEWSIHELDTIESKAGYLLSNFKVDSVTTNKYSTLAKVYENDQLTGFVFPACDVLRNDTVTYHLSGYPYRSIEIKDDPVYGDTGSGYANILYGYRTFNGYFFDGLATVELRPSSTSRKYYDRLKLHYIVPNLFEQRLVGWIADSGSVYNRRITPIFGDTLTITLQYEEGVGITDPITFIQPLVSPINSVEESAEQLVVYPTPSTEFARVDIPVAFDSYEVRVFDATGREQSIDFWRHDNQSLALDIRALSAGVYYVRVHTNTGTYTTQIVRR